MTQITINIEDKSLVPLLKGIIGRLKGVSISSAGTKSKNVNPQPLQIMKQSESKSDKDKERRLKAIADIHKRNFDSSYIDLSDEKTRYLMSK